MSCRNILAILIILLVWQGAAAQSELKLVPVRNGFFGISFGQSYPVGKLADTNSKIGAGKGVYTDLNLGYLLTDRIGYTVRWYGFQNPALPPDNTVFTVGREMKPWLNRGLMAGPLFVKPVSDKFQFDFRPMIGFNATDFPRYDYQDEFKSKRKLAYSAGFYLQYNIWSRFGFHGGVDYFHTKAKFDKNPVHLKQKISMFSAIAALTYRFM